jgi:hypothetical protein
MKKQDYKATLEVSKTPEQVFNCINSVSKWWTNGFEGSSAKLNDEFTISHDGMHYSKQKLVEFVPYKKIVWLVTDSELNWLEKDKHEWTGTKMIFELNPQDDKTILNFTHEGLVPGKECYERCIQGWDILIKDWLFNFMMKKPD